MNKYHQLTETERYHSYGLKRTGLSISAIAKEITRHKFTISREFNVMLTSVVGGQCSLTN
ncbi:MAG: helix-turn-helix domain-containing protein [Hydrogenovibrio crunogenus]|uniref:helix-turn-helix domain-containing protein n=1 Tax=Hydrogenovibrio crunogenus TaxID=39765 RepID=UPI0009FD0CA5|nr:helix-turn-helix domain-containing protein [Hydrogenovibrio crunogenus]